MKTFSKKLYEAMFLVDSVLAASDWDGITATIRTILGRGEAEIISIRKWNETKLAYEIDHKSRGTYILCYFRTEGPRVRDIEREIRLSEKIMRALILNVDHVAQEDIEKDTPVMLAEKRLQGGVFEATTPITDGSDKDIVDDLGEDKKGIEAVREDVDVDIEDVSDKEE